MTTQPARRMIGYTRVSSAEQADSGAGLAAQAAAIHSESVRRSWSLERIEEDAGASGSSMSGRPALGRAIAALEAGEADGLICAKLDRLSRSLLDFCTLMERARHKGWALVALDLAVDTSTPSGELMANVLATFAQFERRIIGQRTRDALAQKRAQGVRLGRPRVVPDGTARLIARQRHAGRTWSAIAEALNGAEVPTATAGARWWPASARTAFLAAQRDGVITVYP